MRKVVQAVTAGMSFVSTELSPQTFWIFAREFSSSEAAANGPPTPIPATVLSVRSSDLRSRFSQQSLPDARVCGSSWSDRRSALGRQATASTGGHVWQAADRFASTRARRAAAARAVKSAGTASPVPKYISSGVCPRNAAC